MSGKPPPYLWLAENIPDLKLFLTHKFLYFPSSAILTIAFSRLPTTKVLDFASLPCTNPGLATNASKLLSAFSRPSYCSSSSIRPLIFLFSPKTHKCLP
jgi:hypothetical protein